MNKGLSPYLYLNKFEYLFPGRSAGGAGFNFVLRDFIQDHCVSLPLAIVSGETFIYHLEITYKVSPKVNDCNDFTNSAKVLI